jgi:hypothetical protein
MFPFKWKDESVVGYSERDYISFFTVYYSNCSILLLIIVNLLLSKIYELNFIINTYV